MMAAVVIGTSKSRSKVASPPRRRKLVVARIPAALDLQSGQKRGIVVTA
jgi:hypothetical protein